MNKHELRSQYNKARAALNPKEQLIAADNLSNHLFTLDCINNAEHIAGYWPSNHEISPLLFLERAMTLNKKCYLPIMMGDKSLLLDFASYKQVSDLTKNKFGILEPQAESTEPMLHKLAKLEIILVPLVAFDKHGNRLGRGAGYYDATLNQLIDLEFSKRPIVIGVAHACQEADNLPTDDWDWRLEIVVTDKDIIHINKKS